MSQCLDTLSIRHSPMYGGNQSDSTFRVTTGAGPGHLISLSGGTYLCSCCVHCYLAIETFDKGVDHLGQWRWRLLLTCLPSHQSCIGEIHAGEWGFFLRLASCPDLHPCLRIHSQRTWCPEAPVCSKADLRVNT